MKQDIFLIVKPSHFHVKIFLSSLINVHTFPLKVSAVMCLHCCFSGSRKVQAVVGCIGSKILLKSCIVTNVGCFVFWYHFVVLIHNWLFCSGQLTLCNISAVYSVCLCVAVLKQQSSVMSSIHYILHTFLKCMWASA